MPATKTSPNDNKIRSRSLPQEEEEPKKKSGEGKHSFPRALAKNVFFSSSRHFWGENFNFERYRDTVNILKCFFSRAHAQQWRGHIFPALFPFSHPRWHFWNMCAICARRQIKQFSKNMLSLVYRIIIYLCVVHSR